MSEGIAFLPPNSNLVRMAAVAAAPKKTAKKPEPVVDKGNSARTGSDKFLDRARQVVVDNYNAYHNTNKTPPLTMELVYVVWFAKTLENWKAIVSSSVVKGMLYEVTYNGSRSEIYVDVYKKINNVKIAD